MNVYINKKNANCKEKWLLNKHIHTHMAYCTRNAADLSIHEFIASDRKQTVEDFKLNQAKPLWNELKCLLFN